MYGFLTAPTQDVVQVQVGNLQTKHDHLPQYSSVQLGPLARVQVRVVHLFTVQLGVQLIHHSSRLGILLVGLAVQGMGIMSGAVNLVVASRGVRGIRLGHLGHDMKMSVLLSRTMLSVRCDRIVERCSRWVGCSRERMGVGVYDICVQKR